MRNGKNIRVIILLVLASSFLSAAITVVILKSYYENINFQVLSSICVNVIEKQPESSKIVFNSIKGYKNNKSIADQENILQSYGYKQEDFYPLHKTIIYLIIIGFVTSAFMILFAFWLYGRKERNRIKTLTAYLEKVNMGASGLSQIQKQLNRLTHLEEALLLLARIDAGTLKLKQEKVDIFTVLNLAYDNLQELFTQSGVLIDIPEMGEIEINADLDWTMEAVMNLLKNCMEHSTSGSMVHCSYEKNPLYVQIRIWDEGKGFDKEDIPHIFQRFYRGKNEGVDGIGIGLSLAKAIIEMQNGLISAFNLPSGGACFEIRFYSH